MSNSLSLCVTRFLKLGLKMNERKYFAMTLLHVNVEIDNFSHSRIPYGYTSGLREKLDGFEIRWNTR